MEPEELISSETRFAGRLLRLRVDTVRLPGGQVSRREVVEHPGAVAVLPVLPSGELVLVRQYRHAVGRALLEVPAGTRQPAESPEACARRELLEETGFEAGTLRELARFYVSPGWANEELIVYLATGLVARQPQPADDERIAVEHVAPERVPELVLKRDIADAKTLVAVLGYLGLHLV
ncbi:NUDIX hydrolase [Thermomicrobiaceae bacterium CFH 74404]|uniref:GDP-mannose pyrophosphatase n=1 Tax=Thermalbibacter longus TaxID=2951981 RepID=A0AA41WF03_9BACT|nr:NUDIX hydrolase [Thermalbibacter longus]MCM8748873.1 NUDIX hydrolase [Thermalbibacter longus]